MEDNLISLVQRLVSIPSIYPDEKNLCDFLVSYFKEKGFEVRVQEVQKGRKNIIVEKGSGERSICLYSHIDTVGLVEGWVHDPYSGAVEGDKLYGLGSYDMKGGMGVCIKAFEEYHPKSFRLKLILCIDEENISRGAHHLLKSGEVDDALCILSPEPAFERGIQGITTGRMGRCLFDMKLERESIHTMFYEPEKDLSLFLGDTLQSFKKMYKKVDTKKQFILARSINSEVVGMSLPHGISVELEASLIPPATADDVLLGLRKCIKEISKNYDSSVTCEVQLKKRETPFLNPYELDENNAYLAAMKKSVHGITAKKAVPYFRSSVADDNIWGSAGKTVLGIGPEGGNAHGPDEWISIQSLKMLQKIFMHFLEACEKLV